MPTQGYLVLADISGYTGFLSGSELEHAQGIIDDLVAAVLESLTPTVSLVKLEGDAVFGHAPLSRFSNPLLLLNLLEACYRDFRDSLRAMQRANTCRCAACANVGQLDLKFVAHRGEYVERQVAGAIDLAGPDVILAHRLLKNSIRESTGLSGYAFLSAACLDASAPVTGAIEHSEEHEPFGTVRGLVFDMAAAADALDALRRVVVEPGEADMEITYQVEAPPSVAWAAFTDGAMAPHWSTIYRSQIDKPNEQGRIGVDAERHCDHGSWSSNARFVDWQPPRYFTLRRKATGRSWQAPPPMLEMTEFIPRDDGGTDVTIRMRSDDRRLLTLLSIRLFWPFARRSMRKDEARLNAFLRETYEFESRASEAATSPHARDEP